MGWWSTVGIGVLSTYKDFQSILLLLAQPKLLDSVISGLSSSWKFPRFSNLSSFWHIISLLIGVSITDSSVFFHWSIRLFFTYCFSVFRFCWRLSYAVQSVSLVAQLCPSLCNPINCSTPGLPFHHQLSELTQTHVHWVGGVIQPSHPLSPPFSSHLQSFPASGSFQMSQFFTSGGQGTRDSASTSVLPMNIQDWSPLGWTGWISLQSRWLSRVFSSTTVQKHQFFGAQLSL